MRKRQKFVLTALILSLGMLLIQMVPLEVKYYAIGTLALVAWFLSVWSLKEGLLYPVWWVILPMPSVFFSLGMALFYLLLPENWFALVVMFVVMFVGHYALLLAGNIFSVAGIRTIALFRAASVVGFVSAVISGFLLYGTILSFRLPFWANGILVFLSSLCIILPALWSVKLEPIISRGVGKYTLIGSLGISLVAMNVGFLPIEVALSSLFLCSLIYVYLGLVSHFLQDRIFRRTVNEYLLVGLVVFVTVIVSVFR